MCESHRQPSDEAASSRLERERRQGPAEIRLMEARDPQSRQDRVRAKPAEGKFIPGGEQHDNRSGKRDVGKCESKLNSRVHGLTCLGTRRKVSASDEIKPTGRNTLTMRHVSMVADGRASAPVDRQAVRANSQR